MEIKEWHLTRENLSHLHAKLSQTDFSKRWVVTCREAKTNRSISQNNMYWEFVTQFGEYLGYEKDFMHDLLRFKFLYEIINIDGEEHKRLLSTAKLDSQEMAKYFEKCLQYSSENGFYFDV